MVGVGPGSCDDPDPGDSAAAQEQPTQMPPTSAQTRIDLLGGGDAEVRVQMAMKIGEHRLAPAVAVLRGTEERIIDFAGRARPDGRRPPGPREVTS